MSDLQYYPLYHPAPKPGVNETTWINDPEGPIWDEDAQLYRAWALYCPSTAENIFVSDWMEFTSPDCVTWTPGDVRVSHNDYNGKGLWGGCVIVDKHNTAGFGKNAVIYLISAAMNVPGGDLPQQSVSRWVAPRLGVNPTFVDYPIENPNDSSVDSDHDFRDPRVFWDKKEKRWVLAISISYGIQFFGSKDTKNWTLLSTWMAPGRKYGQQGGIECPNLFYMPIDETLSDGFSCGDDKRPTGKWVLFYCDQIDSPEKVCAVVGHWNGTSFTPDKESDTLVLDYGVDHYAQTILQRDDDFFMLSWLGNWKYALNSPMEGYKNYLTLIRKLTLIRRGGWYEVRSIPVPGVDDLFTTEGGHTTACRVLGGKHQNLPLKDIETPVAFKLKMRLTAHNGRWPNNINLNIRSNGENAYTQLFLLPQEGVAKVYRGFSGVEPGAGLEAWFESGVAPVDFSTGHAEVVAYVDTASVEYFLQDNDVSITTQIFPLDDARGITLTASEDGRCIVDELTIMPLKQEVIEQTQKNILPVQLPESNR